MHKPKLDHRHVFTVAARLSVKRSQRPIAGKFTKNAAGQDEPAVESIATLEGYPIIWNAVSSDRGGYKVRLLPNSATFTAPTQCFWHHDASKVLGTTANGTLRITPDNFGVKIECDLPDTSDGRDAEELVGEEYVTGMSFAMVNAPDGEMVTENGEQILNAKAYLVDEVTITGSPAFTQTTIAVAEEDFDKNEPPDTEADYDKNEPPDTEADYAAQLATEELRFEQSRFWQVTL